MYGQRLILLNDQRTHILTYFPPDNLSIEEVKAIIERTGKKEGEEFDKRQIFIVKDIYPLAN